MHTMRHEGLPTVPVGPFSVIDATAATIEQQVVAARRRSPNHPTLLAALHVGGLNERHDDGFIQAMRSFDFVYADGISVVTVAKARGALNVERTPTTDFGWAILKSLARSSPTRLKIAVIGGPPGLASKAGEELTRATGGELVFARDGYRTSWTEDLASLRELRPHAVVVGLGMPKEAVWCHQHLSQLPPALIMTCGGWLGFIVGQERRAPPWAQRSGFEWLFRLMQDPVRLAGRYAAGAMTTLTLTVEALIARRRE